MMRRLLLLLLVPVLAHASFTGTDLIVPAAGRVTGAGGTEFQTTLWVTNRAATPATVTYEFLFAGRSEAPRVGITDTIAPGATKTYDDAVATLFDLRGFLGAIRIRSNAEIAASARVFSRLPGTAERDTTGVSIAGIPAAFGVAAGSSTALQGVTESDEFRYNLFVVESAGEPLTFRLDVRDAAGAVVSSRAISLVAYEQQMIPIRTIVPSIAGGSVELYALSGGGRLVATGTQVTNRSQGSVAFPMLFGSSNLAAILGPFVSSVNGLSGALTITGSSNVTVQTSGNMITINAPVAEGPAGPQGAPGPAGPRGPTGPRGFFNVVDQFGRVVGPWIGGAHDRAGTSGVDGAALGAFSVLGLVKVDTGDGDWVPLALQSSLNGGHEIDWRRIAVYHATSDCSGRAYVENSGAYVRRRIGVVNGPSATLWVASWPPTPVAVQIGSIRLGIADRCVAASGTLSLLPLTRLFDLASRYQPPFFLE